MRLYPHPFVIPDFFGVIAGGIHNPHVGKFRGKRGKLFLVFVAARQEFVQFGKAGIIAGDPGVQVAVPVAELDPGNRPDIIFVAKPHKIDYAGTVIDIGKCHGRYPVSFRLFDKPFGRKHAVTQAVI